MRRNVEGNWDTNMRLNNYNSGCAFEMSIKFSQHFNLGYMARSVAGVVPLART